MGTDSEVEDGGLKSGDFYEGLVEFEAIME